MAKILRMILLWPLALGYESIIFIRNRLFDAGIFHSKSFPVPVVCIGNLEVGGSGKTPTADFIIKNLGNKYKIAYLSRGYKRKSNGFVLANPNSKLEDLGDEAFLIYRKWMDRIVLAVDSNRQRGIKRIMELHPETQFILLDDGMQHRWVKSKLLIQLTPFVKPFFRNALLPWGRLRDHPREYRRSDLILFTKAPFASDSQLSKAKNELQSAGFEEKPTFVSALHYGKPINNQQQVLPEKSEVVAVAGLASNLSFFDWVEKHYSVQNRISKPDHFRYLPDFFSKYQINQQIILTTEKDYHKLAALAPDPSRVYYLPIEMEIFPEKPFLNSIESLL